MSGKKPAVEISILAGVTPEKMKLDADEIIVGRAPECAVSIKHRNVSRRHLAIRRKGKQLTVEDLGSSFGTTVNGTKLEPGRAQALAPSDVIMLGSKVRIGVELLQPEITQTELAAEMRLQTTTAAKVSVQKPSQAAPSEPAIPDTAPGFPEPNMSRLPAANDLAEEIIKDAKKQAAVLIKQAEATGEEKVQSFYQRARETEEKANQLYRQRMQDAHQEADRVFETANAKAEKLLLESREQAQLLRERAEQFVSEMQTQSQNKVQELLSEAEKQGREIRERKVREAEEYLKGRENQIADEIRKSLKTEIEAGQAELQASRLENQKFVDQNQKLAVESENENRKLEQTREQVAKIMSEVARIETEATEAAIRHTQLMKEAGEDAKHREQIKKELETLVIERKNLAEEVSIKREDTQAKLQALKVEFEDSRVKLMRQEQEKIDQLKLESVRTSQKFEKELFLELQSNKTRLGREILLATEVLLKSSVPTEAWRTAESELHGKILQILTSPTKGGARAESQSLPDLRRARTRERQRQMFSGLSMGALLTCGVFYGLRSYQNAKLPMQTELASEMAKQKQDLLSRKYDPPQTDQLYDSYVDCVLFTKGFSQRYLSQDFQTAWTKAVSRYLYMTFQLDEDKSLQAIAHIDALITTLQERKAKISPDFVKQDTAKLRELEKTTMSQVAIDLGSEVRLEAFKKFERQFLTQQKP